MGLSLSTPTYSLEQGYVPVKNRLCCCYLGIVDYILTNEICMMVFKETTKTSPKWLYFEGVPSTIMNFNCCSNLIDMVQLKKAAHTFDTFYEMMMYIQTYCNDPEFIQRMIHYQHKTINTAYMDEII
jgi:hypothetical protein